MQNNSNQQVQNPSGNDHNERGTLVGEAGNRKIQKKQVHWGKIQVSNMTSSNRLFLIGYTTEKGCLDFIGLLDFIYENAETYLLKTECPDIDKEIITTYWVILNLGFNIGYKTLKEKFGKSILDSVYLIQKNTNIPWGEEDTLIEYLKNGLTKCFANNSNLTTFNDLLEKEQNRPNLQRKQGVKRKLTFH